MTILMDHFTMAPDARIKNGNCDSFSHNDGYVHNQGLSKLLSIQIFYPSGNATEIEYDE